MATNISAEKLRVELVKTKKAAEALLKVYEELADTIVESGKEIEKAFDGLDFGNAQDIAKVNKLLAESNKLIEDRNKLTTQASNVEKERLKAERELEALEKDRIKTLKEEETLKQQQIKTDILLRKESERQAKAAEKERQQQERLNGAYNVKSKRLNDLRKQYKNLIVEEGKATKETRKLLKEIKSLDKELKDVDASAGQFQRNVGNYPDTIGDAIGSLSSLALALVGVNAGFDGVKSSLEANEEGSEDLRKVQSALEATFNTTANTLATFALDLFDAGEKVVENIKSGKDLSDTFDGVGDSFEKSSKAIDDYTDKVVKNATANVEAEESTIALEKRLRSINPEIANLTGEIEKQNAIAGDSTRSFDQIEKAAERAQVATVKRARLNIQVAQDELAIIQQQLAARSDEANNAELLNKQSEAEIKLTEAQNDLIVEQLELGKVLRENARDRAEIELDFAIDAFDNQKTVNERRIANERLSLEQRRNILEETNKLNESSFQSQVKILEDFTGQKLNLDELAQESDEKVIRQRLKNVITDEKILLRVLEVIKERRTFQQDLVEANNDLTDSENRLLEARADIADQEDLLQRLQKTKGKAEKERVDEEAKFQEELEKNRLESIENELKLVEEGSIIEAELNREKNDILIQQELRRIEKENELADKSVEKEKETAEEKKRIAQESVNFINGLFSDSLARRQEELDEELDANQSAQERIQTGIEQGNEDARRSLAEAEKEEARIREQQEQAKRQEAQLELASALFSSYAETGDIGKTLADASILTQFARSASFYHGTDETPDQVIFDDKYGGVTGFVHAKEQVWSKADRSDVGYRTRDEIKDIVKMHDRGLIKDDSQIVSVVQVDNSELISKVDRMVKSLDTLPVRMPQRETNYDSKKKYIEDITKAGNKTSKLKRKARGTWG
jgi:hypothetical protein